MCNNDMKRFKVYWPFLPFVVLVLAGIAGWFVLPGELTLGSGGTLPKLFGLLAPVAVGAFGGSLAAREKTRWAGAVVIIIAVVMEILLFVWNV